MKAVSWDRISDEQLRLLERLGPRCSNAPSAIALVVMGLQTLRGTYGAQKDDLLVMCDQILEHLERHADGSALGATYVDAMIEKEAGANIDLEQLRETMRKLGPHGYRDQSAGRCPCTCGDAHSPDCGAHGFSVLALRKRYE